MAKTQHTEIIENPVSQIFNLVPEFKKLKVFTKNRLYRFLETKITKFEFKILTSHYGPYKIEDKLNLNGNFREALCKWISQFPEEKRLGFLIAALSIIYITEQEFDAFLDIGIQKINRLLQKQECVTDIPFSLAIPGRVKTKIKPYPTSVFCFI